MKVQITANHVDLSNHHREFIKAQLNSLENLCQRVTGESVSARVTVAQGVLKGVLEVRALLLLPGIDMRAEASDTKLEPAVKKIVSKLARQIKKDKTKHKGRKAMLMAEALKKSDTVEPMMSEIVETEDKGDKDLLSKITKRKVFSNLIAMTPLEALKSMLDLDHEFFIFINSDTDRYNIIYTRRNAAGYGLVELESKSGVLNYKLSDLF